MTDRVPEYDVFISWSGEVSKRIALAAQEWLSTTIQAAVPFVSDTNIDAGDRGLEEIGRQRIVQAARDISSVNQRILTLATRLHDPTMTTSDQPGVPAASDRRFAIQRITQLRALRNQLEYRLLQTIADGIGEEGEAGCSD